jgi:hypothetical protein
MDVSNSPRTERTINGFKVQVAAPYAEGQPLTAAMAAMLNQTFAENISNNTRAQLKAGFVASEGAEATPYTDETAQALIDKYVAEYEPGVRRGGGGEARVTDPIEREARKIASTAALDILKQRGLKRNEVNFSELVDKVFAKNTDKLMAEGKKIVKAQEAAKKATSADNGFDLGDIDVTSKPAEAPAEATV